MFTLVFVNIAAWNTIYTLIDCVPSDNVLQTLNVNICWNTIDLSIDYTLQLNLVSETVCRAVCSYNSHYFTVPDLVFKPGLLNNSTHSG